MARTYTKEDVQTHSDGFGRAANPAVNVKVYGNIRDFPLPLNLGSVSEDGGRTFRPVSSDPGFTWEWIDDNVSDDNLDGLFWMMCEHRWEEIVEAAREILGEYASVHQEGRSGGWAVVTGLPDVEDWDAIQLGKWRRFEKQARAVADGIPYDVLWSIYANQYEAALEDEREEDGLHREIVC